MRQPVANRRLSTSPQLPILRPGNPMVTATSAPASWRSVRHCAAPIEALESRLLLASATLRDGLLIVRGTSRADAIWIHQPPTSSNPEKDPIVVDLRDQNHEPALQFDAGKIRAIHVYGGLGNDWLSIDSLVAPLLRVVTLEGGSGRDHITATFQK